MRIKFSCVLVLAVCAITSLSAHVTVSPLQSKTGAVQKYELRVHNEAKVAATSVDLDIPVGVTAITWQVDVQPGKYVAMPFTAKNPDAATELHWSMHEHLADGSTVDWSD